VTQALSQLTALTDLFLWEQGLVNNPGPIVLPSVSRLSTGNSQVTVQHLPCITAPQLQQLKVFKLVLQPSDLGDLRRLCRGVLKACDSLWLDLPQAWSKEDTDALVAVLHQDWQAAEEALSLLPKGLNWLQLMWVTMDSGSIITQTTVCLKVSSSPAMKGFVTAVQALHTTLTPTLTLNLPRPCTCSSQVLHPGP
jgi:hypothetical protein